mmetsp:Transcript_30156/g.54693  ORF Transcript_30156/g.54693 Transcript_30156/m.54693 type:complete len:566 (+) Transcript_30156:63-1760(+)|eukprot:CAMPEP_0197664946 /NCGR_PEP_ID=MMETSP1338-20131121/58945_1 /TAXON_ID=43686 ORGANISM="Pelagodinium beii, Strain RCC1491" /NCGR_SAMPLE_ID=MMETSP1338 /ASSEMBLY_ACC=CAM_ASM_000754 /LENGTH=565 /DNA_ID=CAMNT_0043243683 /DNA_START=63 /DNA_END=1760 /DNA_ORIENTATION=-
MARRIDALYCDSDSAENVIRSVIQDTYAQAERVRHEVADTIAARVAALQARQDDLLRDIDALAQQKVKTLESQLHAIRGGVCPPAPSEDPDKEPIEGRYLLNADAVISFRLAETDFMEKIAGFGNIGEKSTYASLSYAKGPALGVLKVGNPSYLWVFACDREGVRRTEGGDRVEATLSHPEEFQDLVVEDLKDGRYKVTFIPCAPGSFSLRITVGPEGAEEELNEGPFTLDVRNPTVYQEIGAEEFVEGKLKIGGPGEAHVPDSIGSVHHPSGVAFDHTGKYIFVVDQSNHRVQVFDAATQQALTATGGKGLGFMHFDTPCGIVADRENRVVVSDLLNHRLQILDFNPRTHSLTHAGSVGQMGSGPGEFAFPKGLGLTENGCVLVCDSGNHRVQVLDMLDNFKFVREMGSQGSGEGQFESPLDAAVSCTGEILVSDSNNRIQAFDSKGAFLRMFGLRGRKDGLFHYPSNIAVNDENALFVCDQGNHRVQVFNAADGMFLHKWGGSKKKPAEPVEGEEEAPPPAEEEEGAEKPIEWQGLRCPAGIAVNAYGMVVVSDYQSHTIFAF